MVDPSVRVSVTVISNCSPASRITTVSSFGGACVLGVNFDLAIFSFHVPTTGLTTHSELTNPKAIDKQRKT
jgi:hypothetical protein